MLPRLNDKIKENDGFQYNYFNRYSTPKKKKNKIFEDNNIY